ncbi:MAG: tripartite tricarboxylate transporter TctB family protein [Syntrophobacteraceae bacterium]
MKRNDVLSSIFFFIIGLGICFYAVRTSLGTIPKPGPGLFAFFSGAVLSVLSLGVLFQTLRLPEPASSECAVEAPRWLNIFGLIIAILTYSLTLEYLGYVPTTLLLMLILFRLVEPQPLWVTITGGAAATGLSYLLFHLLKIDLPIGIFGV